MNKPNFKLGEEVRCRLKRIRTHRLERGTIGHITRIPINIKGEFQGYYHVKLPGIPGNAIVAEGLLYRPRRRRKKGG